MLILRIVVMPNLRSTGIVSPIFSSTISLGTISTVGIVMFSLVRIVLIVSKLRLFKESIVFSVLNSY